MGSRPHLQSVELSPGSGRNQNANRNRPAISHSLGSTQILPASLSEIIHTLDAVQTTGDRREAEFQFTGVDLA